MAYDLYPAVDEDYNFPPLVRSALAKSVELRNTVVPMSQTQRNNLSGAELWDGRLIVNTTSNRIDRYDEDSTSWITITSEPAGVVKEYGGDTAPEGHVMADGSVYPRTGIYAPLFAAFGTKYNTGGESGSEFRVVNRKGRVGVGKDAAQTEFDTLGKVSGAKTHTLTEAEMPSHDHGGTQGESGHVHGSPVAGQSYNLGNASGGPDEMGAGTFGTKNVNISGATGGSTGHTHGIPAQGSGNAHNNLQPSIAMNYIITL